MLKILVWKTVAAGGGTIRIEERWYRDAEKMRRLYRELRARLHAPRGTPALSWEDLDAEGRRTRHSVSPEEIEYVQLFEDGREITEA